MNIDMDGQCTQGNAQERVVAIPWTTFQPKISSTLDEAESPKKDQDAETEAILVSQTNAEVPQPSEGDLGSCVVLQKRLPLVSQFSRLKQNADLNLPPPNWMKQTSEAGQYFQRPLFSQFEHPPSSPERPSSSILLASHYPEKVGRVDVISDAKNVKKLLMLPYSHSDVSMAVHRVSNTLLVDELKPSVMTLRSSCFRKLFGSEKMPNLLPRKKDPASSRHRNMYSKLLYYSLRDQPSSPMLSAGEDTKDHTHSGTNDPLLFPVARALPLKDGAQNTDQEFESNQTAKGLAPISIVPQCSSSSYATDIPRREDETGERLGSHFPCLLPEPTSQPFHLNVEWTIKDIRMLLGSDLPIFGKGGHPALSLKLRDMQKPITVLTGLDYWLDNLMCNVPELVMCFHINGIVQKYEIIKTEDIPKLDKDSQFSPQEVQEVAQNILSFLKANCTKEGHTYWLFRPKGDDVVKLYDLTSLMASGELPETGEDNAANPFAANVALLFYRVSQRMLKYDSPSSEDLAIVKLLLENCIKLLKDDRNSQIVVSSYFLLADLVLKCVVPSNATPFFEKQNKRSSGGFEGVAEGGARDRVRVVDEKGVDRTEEVRRPKNRRKRNDSSSSSTVLTVTESSSMSVSHLRETYLSAESPPTAPPIEPLVIGSKQDRARMTLGYITKGLSMAVEWSKEMNSWKLEASAQLVQLAAQTYWILAETANELNKLGRALRYLRHCILCYKASLHLPKSVPQSGSVSLYRAWLLVGDVHCLLTKASGSFSSHLEDFQSQNPEDSDILNVASSIYGLTVQEDGSLTLHKDIGSSLKKSIECYEHCQELLVSRTERSKEEINRTLKERLGNAWNELGVFYKHLSSTMDFSKESKQVEELWSDSYQCLTKGLEFFNSTHNSSNQALLNANLGSLMRLRAETNHLMQQEQNMDGFSDQEELYYTSAMEYYTRGREAVRRTKGDRSIWYSLECDLAALHYSLGQQLQERPPLSKLSVAEIEREILSHYMKAFHHAESAFSHTPPQTPKHVALSQFIGDCHHKLASLYLKTSSSSSSTTTMTSSQKLKFSQAEKHYDKALQYYLVSHHQLQMLRVYLEKAFLYEQEAAYFHGKQAIRLLQSSLENLLQLQEVLEHVKSSMKSSQEKRKDGAKESSDTSCDHSGTSCDPKQLMDILVQRLQCVLKQLLTIAKKGDSKAVQPNYKKVYGLALKTKLSSDISVDIEKIQELLRTVRDTIHA